MYRQVFEKKITSAMWKKQLRTIVGWEMKDAKIIVMYTPREEKVHKMTPRLRKLSEETEKSTLRFNTTEEAMAYLDS